ncbi:MAG: hypothetical protein ACREXS_12185 [Gammaproteobacteria bacterium]
MAAHLEWAVKWRGLLLGSAATGYFAITLYVYQAFHVLMNPVYDGGAFVLAYWVAGKIKQKWST